jgi:uncharacterized protein YdhG (YjbR/CyaY superfamily)
MPAYANAEGKAVVFVQSADKFKTRYCTLGFNDSATLDKGDAWPTAFAIAAISDETEKLIRQQVKRAVT